MLKKITKSFVRKKERNTEKEFIDKETTEVHQNAPKETIAAISMALHLFFNSARDEESEVITINMPSAHYSPWALKSLVMKRVVKR